MNIRLTKSELSLFKKLKTPQKIQNFLDTLAFNHEKNGETCMSPRMVLKKKKAHCIEGAMLAATAMHLLGQKPLVVNLKVKKGDYDHIITLYKQNSFWGAISKTNHSVLRFRDPVYKTVRELVLSYFHEYFLNTTGEKTLIGYTNPINLKKFGTKWITSTENLWDIAETIYDTPIIKIVPEKNKKFIRKASSNERAGASIPDSLEKVKGKAKN
jgi:hypothetical protein